MQIGPLSFNGKAAHAVECACQFDLGITVGNRLESALRGTEGNSGFLGNTCDRLLRELRVGVESGADSRPSQGQFLEARHHAFKHREGPAPLELALGGHSAGGLEREAPLAAA